jgi:cytochrome c oxidase subunit 1
MLPGFGFVSDHPVFARKVIFGYATLVAAAVSIGVVALTLGAPHVRGGAGRPVTSLRGLVMSSPCPRGSRSSTGWAMYGGSLIFKTPMLFCCAFCSVLCAGLTGS